MEIIKDFSEVPTVPYFIIKCKDYEDFGQEFIIFNNLILPTFYISGNAFSLFKPKEIAKKTAQIYLSKEENPIITFELEEVHPHCLQIALEVFYYGYYNERALFLNSLWDYPEIIANICVIGEMLEVDKINEALDRIFSEGPIIKNPNNGFSALWICDRFHLRKTIKSNQRLLDVLKAPDVETFPSNSKEGSVQITFKKNSNSVPE